jgi:hypothetical protein
MRGERGAVVALARSGEAGTRGLGSRGRIVSWSRAAGVRVEFAGNAGGPLRASSTLRLTALELDHAVATQQPVLLVFEDGDVSRPVVVGLLFDEPWADAEVAAPASETEAEPSRRFRAFRDGKEVLVEGGERVELRCGKARIILTRSGRIILRGTYISSQSSGVQRIRGGSVEIN